MTCLIIAVDNSRVLDVTSSLSEHARSYYLMAQSGPLLT